MYSLFKFFRYYKQALIAVTLSTLLACSTSDSKPTRELRTPKDSLVLLQQQDSVNQQQERGFSKFLWWVIKNWEKDN